MGKPVQASENWLEEAIAVLRRGGVVALPFERLFGLAANALDEQAVARVAAIKGRSGLQVSRPISVILPRKDDLPRVAASFPFMAEQLAGRYWPGPLTLVVKAMPGLPLPLVSERGAIGLRVAGPCPAAELAAGSGLVLTATSANPGGGGDSLTSEELAELEGVDLVVPGQVPGPPGSTVVDVTEESPVILRPGVGSVDLK